MDGEHSYKLDYAPKFQSLIRVVSARVSEMIQVGVLK